MPQMSWVGLFQQPDGQHGGTSCSPASSQAWWLTQSAHAVAVAAEALAPRLLRPNDRADHRGGGRARGAARCYGWSKEESRMTGTEIERRDEAVAEAITSGRSLPAVRKEVGLTISALHALLEKMCPDDTSGRERM